MNALDFEKTTYEQFNRCMDLLGVKNKEYTPGGDRLQHFKKAASLEGSTPKAALFGMLAKHLISVADMCNSKEQFDKDRWSEKITDTINYMVLLWALVKEEQNEQN